MIRNKLFSRILNQNYLVKRYSSDYEELKHYAKTYLWHPTRPNDPRVGFDPIPKPESEKQTSRVESISKAMSSYLKRAKEYEKFMSEQNEEFQIGKRHLQNIMGFEHEMSQNDIDTAIAYLMPSGVFDKRARPLMRPPKNVFPQVKDAQFDTDGRPFHTFFYTAKPNYYEVSYNISEYIEQLNRFEDRLLAKGMTETAKVEMHASQWLSYNEMKTLLIEKFDEQKYENLIESLNRLAEHPYSKRVEEFIMNFRKEMKQVTAQMEIPPLQCDENGRHFSTGRGMRKYCIANVVVRGNGTGNVLINGRDIRYFDYFHDREQIMAPLLFCNLLFKVDIECETMHEEETKINHPDVPMKEYKYKGQLRPLGTSAQSGAIRLALANALRSFVDKDTVEKMRISGFLTKDVRRRERKKWGREGARRKYTWRKR